MSEVFSDDELRSELESFDATVGKINDKTRPILVKKLNHFRARLAMSQREREKEEKRSKSRERSSKNRPSKPLEQNGDGDASFSSAGRPQRQRRNIDLNSQSPLFDSPTIKKSNKQPTSFFGGNSEQDAFSSLTSGGRLVTDYSDTEVDVVSVGINTSLPYSDSSMHSIPSPTNQYRSPTHQYNSPTNQFRSPKDEFRSSTTNYNNTENYHTTTSYNHTTPFNHHTSPPPPTKHFNLTPSKFKPPQNHQPSSTISKIIIFITILIFFIIISIYLHKAFLSSFVPSIKEKDMCMKVAGTEVCLSRVEKSALEQVVMMLALKSGEAVCKGSFKKRLGVMTLIMGGGDDDDDKKGGDDDDDDGGKGDGRMGVSELVNHLMKKFDDVGKTDKYEVNVLKLLLVIQHRPDWNITLSCQAEDCKPQDVKWLLSRSRVMSLWCRVRRAINAVTWRAVLALAGVVLLVWLWLFVAWWRARVNRARRQVKMMANQIIDLLQRHSTQNLKKTSISNNNNINKDLLVSEVRDALIPPSQQHAMIGVWNKAVECILKEDGRLVQEEMVLHGQDVVVWKWLPEEEDKNEQPSTAATHTRKSMRDREPMVMVSSCFKLVNILPPSHVNEVPRDVMDGILDKCGEYHGVLHMACDHSYEQGAVYVKCVSESAAKQNHTALHGWSYNGRVVVVRYMSGVVYTMMFEDSQEAMLPLKSSKARRKSLQRRGLL